MIKLRHETLIVISGLVWLAIGIFLMTLGLNFIVEGTKSANLSDLPVLGNVSPLIGGVEEAALVLIALSLFIGHMKGRHVLGKSANRGIQRIRSFENPTSLTNIYSMQYYILIAVMIGLGMSMKFLGLSPDVRGAVDVAVGAALISGAMIYFRNAYPAKSCAKSCSTQGCGSQK